MMCNWTGNVTESIEVTGAPHYSRRDIVDGQILEGNTIVKIQCSRSTLPDSAISASTSNINVSTWSTARAFSLHAGRREWQEPVRAMIGSTNQ